MIFTLWTAAVVVMLPHLWIQRLEQRLSWQHEKYPPIRIAYLCVEYFPKISYNICYSIGFFLAFFVLPVAVMAYAYGHMANVLWLRGDIGEPLTSSQIKNKREWQKRNIIRMLIVIVLCYIVCWLPFFAVNIVILFCKFTNTVRIVQAFALLFGYSNAFVNALIYFFLNAKFNRLIKEKLAQLCQSNTKSSQQPRARSALLSHTTSMWIGHRRQICKQCWYSNLKQIQGAKKGSCKHTPNNITRHVYVYPGANLIYLST